MGRDERTTWKKSATMSLSVECGPAVVPEWYASLPKHYTVRYAHVPVDGDAAKAVGSRTTIMKGLDHRSFAQVDCGDEVKELCEFVHFLGPAHRREHLMS